MTEKHEQRTTGHLALAAANEAQSQPRFWATLLALLALFSACNQSPPQENPPATKTATTAPAAQEPAAEEPAAEEIWDVFYLQGTKIGYGHTTVQTVRREGRELLQVDALNHLSITRFGETTEQEVRMGTVETPSGDVLDFSTTINFGPAPTVIKGRVVGDQLSITTQTQGRTATSNLPWTKDTRGFRAIEQSLAAKPLVPGEKRSLRMLMPIVNQIATVELAAREYEKTAVLGTEVRLLRIDSLSGLPGGQSIDTTLWTDDRGNVIKTHMAALQQESFRTTEKIALAPAAKDGALDLGLDLFVKVEPPLKNPLKTSQVTYRVELADGDPAKVFASGPTQSIKSLGPHVAEITVRSIRPGELPESATPRITPTAEFTTANSVLQIDDPRIRKMAAEGKAKASKPSEVAVALEHYVHGAVNKKNFSHGFATAAEVAESRAGDCTEHAVLLAALLRAEGLPSRVAIGLVYVDRAASFGYHMWTEVLLDGRWVPLDAILGAGGTSAAYLKLNDSSLDGAGAYSTFLSVAQVLGQLKVSVVSAQ